MKYLVIAILILISSNCFAQKAKKDSVKYAVSEAIFLYMSAGAGSFLKDNATDKYLIKVYDKKYLLLKVSDVDDKGLVTVYFKRSQVKMLNDSTFTLIVR